MITPIEEASFPRHPTAAKNIVIVITLVAVLAPLIHLKRLLMDPGNRNPSLHTLHPGQTSRFNKIRAISFPTPTEEKDQQKGGDASHGGCGHRHVNPLPHLFLLVSDLNWVCLVCGVVCIDSLLLR